jgi:hypothetical protein
MKVSELFGALVAFVASGQHEGSIVASLLAKHVLFLACECMCQDAVFASFRTAIEVE